MRKTVFLLILFLFLHAAAGFGADFSYIYGSMAEAFPNLDPNAGLTSFPTLLIPMGGKYEGMGTAFTAVADDSSFLEANPSASSLLEYTELSFTHNNWIADSNMEGVIYTMRFNDLGIGLGGKFLYVPFTEYNDWGERVSKGYYSETVATVNVSYNFFSSYYFYGVALGSNVKVAYRHLPEAIYPDQSSAMAMLDIGLLTRLNFAKFYASRSKNFSVGLVLKNLGPPLLLPEYGPSAMEPLPTQITAGVAYSPIRPITIALDFNLPISFYADYPAEQWSFAGGTDIAFTDFFSIHAGFRFKGATPRLSIGSTIDLNKITFVLNYTLDMATQVGALDRFSVEAKLKIGDRGRAALQAKIDELYTAGLEAYAGGNIKDAIAKWEELLKIDPEFQPAAQLLKTAQNALSLEQQMEQILQVQ
ncbi:MAG: hypothetical protein E4H36_10905 [Spirochaetales bacterium]|nr:MAG: hypothetical protein E4H36_10905 [Spirochaetales bacterium]